MQYAGKGEWKDKWKDEWNDEWKGDRDRMDIIRDSRICRMAVADDGSGRPAGMSFGRQLEALQEGAYPQSGNLMVMRHTPAILQELGLCDRPILFARKHVESCLAEYCDETHCHGISPDTLRKLPGYLTYPVMVLDSEQRMDSIVVLTEGQDHLQQPVIASIRIEGRGSADALAGETPQRRPAVPEMKVNYITACYGKRPRGLREMIRRAVHDGRVLYADSRKLSRLFYRLQLEPPYEVRWITYDCIAAESRNAERVLRPKSEFAVGFTGADGRGRP